MGLLKNIVRPAVRRLGFDIVRFNPQSMPSPADRLRQRLLSDLNVDTVIDVGANVGQFASGVRKHGFTGRIISFEPLLEPFTALRSRSTSDGNWQAINLALAATAEETQLNVAANSESSSLLPMGQRHLDAAPESAYVSTQTVRSVTLDSLCDELLSATKTAWLKIDVQGTELLVLAGAVDTLKRVAGIEIELSLVQLYEGQPLIEDAIRQLRSLGYEMTCVESVFDDPRTGHTLQLAGLFVRGDRVQRSGR